MCWCLASLILLSSLATVLSSCVGVCIVCRWWCVWGSLVHQIGFKQSLFLLERTLWVRTFLGGWITPLCSGILYTSSLHHLSVTATYRKLKHWAGHHPEWCMSLNHNHTVCDMLGFIVRRKKNKAKRISSLVEQTDSVSREFKLLRSQLFLWMMVAYVIYGAADYNAVDFWRKAGIIYYKNDEDRLHKDLHFLRLTTHVHSTSLLWGFIVQ